MIFHMLIDFNEEGEDEIVFEDWMHIGGDTTPVQAQKIPGEGAKIARDRVKFYLAVSRDLLNH